MTDTPPLTDVIVDALDNAGVQSHYLFDRGDGLITLDGRFDIDRLATAIRDHFLNRDRIADALAIGVCREGTSLRDYEFEAMVDGLIEGLSR